MKRTLIRYRTKPDTDRRERSPDQGGVRRNCTPKSPEGIRYLSLKLGDGSFVHFVANEAGDQPSILPSLKAFGAFQNGIRDRCSEPPQSGDVTIVGNYRMLSDESLASVP